MTSDDGEMDVDDDDAVEHLLRERAEREWLRGEHIQALATVDQVDQGRYRVRGLDHDGLPPSGVDRALDSLQDTNHPGIFTAVRGDDPGCLGVGAYKAVRFDDTWLTITPQRVAVLRLRDTQKTTDDLGDELLAQAKQERSVGGLLRGVGKLLTSSAVELAKSVRRPPLSDRPQDAILERPFEVPAGQLHSITPWKRPMMPTFRGGPRFVQVQFADGSWVRLMTDAAGLAALTGRT